MLTKAFTSIDVRDARRCTPELWHIFHPKSVWAASADGKARVGLLQQARRLQLEGNITFANPDDWTLSYPENGLLQSNNALKKHYRCRHRKGAA